MLAHVVGNKPVALAAIVMLIAPAIATARARVVDIEFGAPPGSGSDTTRTLQSLVKVQGEGGLCQDALYLIDHVGDFSDLFESQNRATMENSWRDDTWRYCSVFSATSGKGVLMGRNWDNQNVGSIIVSRYHPAGGYASVSFSRAIDMEYPLNIDLEQIKGDEFATKLLLAPFYAMDGMNEKGLMVALTGLSEAKHDPKRSRDLIFVTYLIREILDRTKTVADAIALAEKYTPFDLDRTSFNGHIFIADASGSSVILEYENDQWRKIPSEGSWQVLTNKAIYNVSEATLKEKCWRYRSICETLENDDGNIDWQSGMKILQDVSQKGTTWSVIYLPAANELYLSVYQNWDVVYRLKGFQSPNAGEKQEALSDAGRPEPVHGRLQAAH